MERRRIGRWLLVGVLLLAAMSAGIFLLVKAGLDRTKEQMHPVAGVESIQGYPPEAQIAEQLLNKYLASQGADKFLYTKIRNVTLLEEQSGIMKIAVTFRLELPKEEQGKHGEWGVPDCKGALHCQWVLTARLLNDGKAVAGDERVPDGVQYELGDVEYLDNYLQAAGKTRKELEIPALQVESTCFYRVEENTVSVTWDGGKSWVQVPEGLDTLTVRGTEEIYTDELQPGSYYISPEKIAFVYGGSVTLPCTLLLSDDQGKTWRKTPLPVYTEPQSSRQWVKVCFVNFAPDGTGSIAVGTDWENMAESEVLFKSTDGGESWQSIPSAEVGFSLARGIVFLNEEIGFYSREGELFRTEDGGQSWKKCEFDYLDELQSALFHQPQTPVFADENNGFVNLQQGADGDWGDGSLVLRYVTTDGGLTWSYDQQVLLEEVPMR